MNQQLAFRLQKNFKIKCGSFLVRLHDAFILIFENSLGKMRTVKAYCLNVDLKHVFPCVVHFSRTCWV